jgi:hypothetical protein
MSQKWNLAKDIALLERKLRNAERFQVQFQNYIRHLEKLLRIAERAKQVNELAASPKARSSKLARNGSAGPRKVSKLKRRASRNPRPRRLAGTLQG